MLYTYSAKDAMTIIKLQFTHQIYKFYLSFTQIKTEIFEMRTEPNQSTSKIVESLYFAAKIFRMHRLIYSFPYARIKTHGPITFTTSPRNGASMQIEWNILRICIVFIVIVLKIQIALNHTIHTEFNRNKLWICLMHVNLLWSDLTRHMQPRRTVFWVPM